MPAKKRPERPPSATRTGRVEIMLEEVLAQNRATIEAVAAAEQRLEQKLGDRLSRVEGRLDVIESVVKQNSQDIRKNSEDIRKNSEDIRKNSEDIRKNSEDIAGLADNVRRLEAKLDQKADRDVEERVAALERARH